MGVVFENLDYRKLHWQSDWNGDEIGYPCINVVGLYTKDNINFYINTENNEVLKIWMDEKENE